jgi:hypothetical protein
MYDGLKNMRKALTEELASLGGAIRGTIVVTKKKCGRKGCECQKKKRALHPFRYLSTAKGVGKTKIVYVKEAEMPAFSSAVVQYRRIKEIIDELSEVNTRLIKAGVENDD